MRADRSMMNENMSGLLLERKGFDAHDRALGEVANDRESKANRDERHVWG